MEATERHGLRREIGVTAEAGGLHDVGAAIHLRRPCRLTDLALSCEPQCLRGSLEAPSFVAKRYHGTIGTRCGSSASALLWRQGSPPSHERPMQNHRLKGHGERRSIPVSLNTC
jgi:hypothetical protein